MVDLLEPLFASDRQAAAARREIRGRRTRQGKLRSGTPRLGRARKWPASGAGGSVHRWPAAALVPLPQQARPSRSRSGRGLPDETRWAVLVHQGSCRPRQV